MESNLDDEYFGSFYPKALAVVVVVVVVDEQEFHVEDHQLH